MNYGRFVFGACIGAIVNIAMVSAMKRKAYKDGYQRGLADGSELGNKRLLIAKQIMDFNIEQTEHLCDRAKTLNEAAHELNTAFKSMYNEDPDLEDLDES